MSRSGRDVSVGSRRSLLAGSAALLAGGGLGGVITTFEDSASAATKATAAPPPLPWKWGRLDSREAGRRAYRLYVEKGSGCGTASYLSLLGLLKEKVGYPWTTLPDLMMSHAQAGYAGHGTLCGALGGVSTIINLATYTDNSEKSKQIIDRLFWWYSEQDFPTERFDDISKMPKQIRVQAMSPLCHTSVSKWTLAAGATVTSKEKKERCGKVAGEVAYTVAYYLNEYFDGKWIPAVWKPSEQIEHCVQCHSPDDMWQSTSGQNRQQGHMECLMCHSDHTAKAVK